MQRTGRVIAVALALVCVLGLAHATGFELTDGDSRLYARIAHTLAGQPVTTWMDPRWPHHWYKSGRFEEHSAVFFWFPAMLGKAGLPETVAMLAANAIYVVMLLTALFMLVRRHAGSVEGWFAVTAWMLSAGGMHFMLRGNHEVPLALGVVAAVLGLVEGRAWIVMLGAAWCVATKGIVGSLVVPVLGAWWVGLDRTRRGFQCFVAGIAGIVLTTILYEQVFQHLHGCSFIAAYLDIHVGYAEARQRGWAWSPVVNLGSYAAAALYWSAPAGLLLLAGKSWRREPLVCMSVVTACIYCGFFALFDRTASRYIFSAQPFLVMAGAFVAVRRWPVLGRHVAAQEGRMLWWAVLLGVALMIVRIMVHRVQQAAYVAPFG